MNFRYDVCPKYRSGFRFSRSQSWHPALFMEVKLNKRMFRSNGNTLFMSGSVILVQKNSKLSRTTESMSNVTKVRKLQISKLDRFLFQSMFSMNGLNSRKSIESVLSMLTWLAGGGKVRLLRMSTTVIQSKIVTTVLIAPEALSFYVKSQWVLYFSRVWRVQT